MLSLDKLAVLEPYPGVLAFYDGRVEGHRFAEGPNWVDDGALSLGIASYAIVSGAEAIVFDTHVSVEHGRFIRRFLEQRGVQNITVVLSHWHLDHVAGTAAFADRPVIANEMTASLLVQNQAGIEDGSLHGLPAINPLVLPTRTFADRLSLSCGSEQIELMQFNIHSKDGTVIWMKDRSILLAADTIEDTVTYVAEADEFTAHLTELDRLSDLKPRSILPNHGDRAVIEGGGYSPEIIRVTQRYIRFLQKGAFDPTLQERSLAEILPEIDPHGACRYFAPYEEVHRRNLASVQRQNSAGTV